MDIKLTLLLEQISHATAKGIHVFVSLEALLRMCLAKGKAIPKAYDFGDGLQKLYYVTMSSSQRNRGIHLKAER